MFDVPLEAVRLQNLRLQRTVKQGDGTAYVYTIIRPMTRTPLQRFAFHAILGLLLTACYPVQQLFSGNQNVYFLWGMAKAGIGSLHLDPLLAQTDPFPLFSLLVLGVMKFLHPWVFHLLYWTLNTVYVHALLGIADHLFDTYGRPAKMALLTALFLLMHSGAIWAGLFRIMFGLDLSWAWDSGLAEQGVLRGYLQPSVVGVFLLLSVLFFLRKQPQGVFLSLAAAAIIHPNYLFLGAVMGMVYLIQFLREKSISMVQAIVWVGFSALLVMPQLFYAATFFLPHTEEESAMMREAVARTQDGNIHLSPALWLTAKTFLQLGVVATCLLIFRKEMTGRLLLALVGAFGLLSAATFLFDSQTLLSLTPWRISVVLVPVCSVLLLGKIFLTEHAVELRRRTLSALLIGGVLLASFGFYRLFGSADEGFIYFWRAATIALALLAAALPFLPSPKLRSPVATILVSLGIIVGSVGSGILEMVMEQRFRSERPEQGVIGYLKKNSISDEVVMMPTSMTTLRMNAGVAVVADDNLVHGLSLPDLLDRKAFVREFYEGDITEELLMYLKLSYDCTAIVLPLIKEIPTDLQLQEIYRDAYYRVVRL